MERASEPVDRQREGRIVQLELDRVDPMRCGRRAEDPSLLPAGERERRPHARGLDGEDRDDVAAPPDDGDCRIVEAWAAHQPCLVAEIDARLRPHPQARGVLEQRRPRAEAALRRGRVPEDVRGARHAPRPRSALADPRELDDACPRPFLDEEACERRVLLFRVGDSTRRVVALRVAARHVAGAQHRGVRILDVRAASAAAATRDEQRGDRDRREAGSRTHPPLSQVAPDGIDPLPPQRPTP